MSPVGKWFARTGGMSGVHLWKGCDKPGFWTERVYHREETMQTGMALSPDSNRFAYSVKTAEGPSVVELVDLTSPQLQVVKPLARLLENGITAIVFHEDGWWLLTGTGFGELYSWDLSKVEKAKPLYVILPPRNANFSVGPNIVLLNKEGVVGSVAAKFTWLESDFDPWRELSAARRFWTE